VEQEDGLYAAAAVVIDGPSWTATGETAYGAHLWIETDAAVKLVDAERLG
jgi:hypothetical protein